MQFRLLRSEKSFFLPGHESALKIKNFAVFNFKILKKSKFSKARLGTLVTPHGAIETPAFLPVGTVGAVKTMLPSELKAAGAQVVLANAYHLYLRPGSKLVKQAGGLHRFMGWNGPILTDSGGFQVFSLGETRVGLPGSQPSATHLKPARVSERGVTFYSHLDGTEHFLTPEDVVEIQKDLGADLATVLDVCPPAQAAVGELRAAQERTHRWLMRSLKVRKSRKQCLVPICQGGANRELREASARFISNVDLPVNAIGGVAVGESKEKIYEVAKWCTDILPDKKPRYLMGIGYPEDIAKVVSLGIDLFDCVLPTRLARHGVVWVKSPKGSGKKIEGLDYSYEQLDLNKAKFRQDFAPLSRFCSCPACISCVESTAGRPACISCARLQRCSSFGLAESTACAGGFSRAYLHHLLREGEILGLRLLTAHNLKFVFALLDDLKRKI